MSIDQARAVDNLDFIKGGATAFTILAIVASFDLLPTWMFINSASLLAHTSMINVDVPGNANHLLVKWIDLFRLNWWDVNENTAQRVVVPEQQVKDDTYLEGILTRTGYMHNFSLNLVVMVGVAIFLLAIWQCCAIKDCIGSWTRHWILRPLRGRHEPIVTNFTLRFVYELFLEMCLCITITMVFAGSSDSFGGELQWVIAIALAVGLLLLIMGLVTFCCCNGPYHPGYFARGSAWSSLFGPPRYDPDIRDYYELQRLSRKSRLGNWNDMMSLSFSGGVVSSGFSWSWAWNEKTSARVEDNPIETEEIKVEQVDDEDPEDPLTERNDPANRNIVLLAP